MRKSYHLLFVVSMYTLFSMKAALANDTAVGGEGSLPIPISQPNIEMTSETIIISGKNLNTPEMDGSWQYDCNFTFKNSSNIMLKVPMGFPSPVNSGESQIALPAGHTSSKGKSLVYDFKVTVNGQATPSHIGKIATNPDKSMYYEEAYYWDTIFPANSEIIIHHGYITGATYDVMGYHWVYYVLKTGALWKNNTIGHTRLEVIPNTPTRLCYEIDSDLDVLNPKPAGLQITGDGANRKYVWDLKHFQPSEDMSLCVFTGLNYVRYKTVYKWLNTENAIKQLKELSPKQIRLLRNTVFAQYGRSFEDPVLQDYFNQQWWYVPNSLYSDKMLTADDKKFLSLLKQAQ